MLESYNRNKNSISEEDGRQIKQILSKIYNEAIKIINNLKNELILNGDEDLYMKISNRVDKVTYSMYETSSNITGPNINSVNKNFMHLEDELLQPTCTRMMLENYIKTKYSFMAIKK